MRSISGSHYTLMLEIRPVTATHICCILWCKGDNLELKSVPSFDRITDYPY